MHSLFKCIVAPSQQNYHFWAFTLLDFHICKWQFSPEILGKLLSEINVHIFSNFASFSKLYMRLFKMQSLKLPWSMRICFQDNEIFQCVEVICKIELNCECVLWLQIPQDRTIVRRVLRTVSLSLFVCMSTISGCGIFVAIALIVFNIWNNHRRWVSLFFWKKNSYLCQLHNALCANDQWLSLWQWLLAE